jgi:hypothetical protein
MGNAFHMGARLTKDETGACTEDIWPYVWAIEDPEILDWKIGKNVSFSVGEKLTNEDIIALDKKQCALPVAITTDLYLSNHRCVCDVDLLKQAGITHVLNVAGPSNRGPLAKYAVENIMYKEIAAEDEDGYYMLQKHLSECMEFIQSAKATGGKAVVHCAAGINRSGVIAAAYHLLTERVSILDSVAHCRRQRGNCFLWNHTFQIELACLARDQGLLGPAPGPDTGSCVSIAAPPYQCALTGEDHKKQSKNIANIFR